MRALEEVKPKYFLLENVKMKQEYQDIISKHLGISPIEIDSALVSAQRRKRLYWTNIPNIKQPCDKSLLVKDVIERHIITIHNPFTIRETPNYVRPALKRAWITGSKVFLSKRKSKHNNCIVKFNTQNQDWR